MHGQSVDNFLQCLQPVGEGAKQHKSFSEGGSTVQWSITLICSEILIDFVSCSSRKIRENAAQYACVYSNSAVDWPAGEGAEQLNPFPKVALLHRNKSASSITLLFF